MKTKGFTLLELIVAATLFTVVATAMTHFFFTGRRVYSRLNPDDQVDAPLSMFLEILQRDVQRLVPWQNRHLVLQADRLYFHTDHLEGMGRLERVDYLKVKRYEGSGEVVDLVRETRTYPYVTHRLPEPETRITLLKGYEAIDLKALAKVYVPAPPKKDRGFDPFPDETTEEVGETYALDSFDDWSHAESPAAVEWSLKHRTGVKQWLEWLPMVRFQRFLDLDFIEPPVTGDEDPFL